MPNSELMRMAREAAAEMMKEAVIPAGGDPAAGGDPSMAGGAPPGMDPSMMGGAAPPPGADPSAAMAPTDPALAAAGGGPQDMVRQMVQQEMQNQGAGGKAGPNGKPAKPDMAVELQEVKETLYKYGVILMAIANAVQAEIPSSAIIGQPPESVDPMLAAAGNSMPVPGSDPSQGGGAPPAGAAGGGEQPFPPIPPMSGDVGEGGGKQAADMSDLLEVANGIRQYLDMSAVDADELLGSTPKQAEAAPAPVGGAIAPAQLGPMPQQPLALARMIRQRALGISH